MTNQEALLAMKIGCKISNNGLKPGTYYYLKNNRIYTSVDSTYLMTYKIFLRYFKNTHNWYIV